VTPVRAFVAGALLCAVLGGAAPAVAAAGPDGAVTWSVAPADADGPDGRRVIDIELDPGSTGTEHVAVTNHSDQTVSFGLAANDGYLTEQGSFDMLPSSAPPSGGGAWLVVPDEVTVGAGATEIVPVEIAVPEDAIPGDHPAGVTASLRSGGEMDVEYRVGVRVNLRVTGEVIASLAVDVVDASYRPSWNPFAPGEVVVVVAVVNDGTVGVGLAGNATASSRLTGASGSGPPAEVAEVLPGGRVEVGAHVPAVWPLGPTRIATEINGVLPEDLAEVALPVTVTATTDMWALPVTQLLALLVVALAVLGLWKVRRRRQARLERLLEEARADGAARALAEERS
jgi:hypothetical protein